VLLFAKGAYNRAMPTRLIRREEQDPALPLKLEEEEYFCLLYASHAEFCGNGVQSYIEAFGVDVSENGAYKRAMSNASYLLKKSHVLQRINYFLDVGGFNDANADKQLNFLMMQNADLKAKMAAIKEYNALKGRVKQRLEFSFSHMSDAELEAEKHRLEKEIVDAEAVTHDGMPLLAPHGAIQIPKEKEGLTQATTE
jgi:hypothetical protein